MGAAYYNEIDKFNVEWLKELMKAGVIAPGEVDDRSIEDVQPSDLKGFTQCHFFAGIGVWSYALRAAGWRDDEPVWTGSCPCPPFSSAGKRKSCPRCGGEHLLPHVGRTGFFVCCHCSHEWLADARHLWPELWRLISFGHPDKFFGEQVAAQDGRMWLSLVRASLEILGYAVGATDICSAGVGASDIRQRLYFVAVSETAKVQPRLSEVLTRAGANATNGFRDSRTDELENATRRGCGERRFSQRRRVENTHESEPPCRLVHASEHRLANDLHISRDGAATDAAQSEHEHPDSKPRRAIEISSLDNACRSRRKGREQRGTLYAGGGKSTHEPTSESSAAPVGTVAESNGAEPSDGGLQGSGRLVQLEENPLTGFWANAEWIYCRDGKYRAVEPGTFPLAHGAPARVGRLRGYGNAINAEVAKVFIEASIEALSEVA